MRQLSLLHLALRTQSRSAGTTSHLLGVDVLKATADDVQRHARHLLAIDTLPRESLNPASWLLLSGYVEEEERFHAAPPKRRVLLEASPPQYAAHQQHSVDANTKRRRNVPRTSLADLDAYLDGDLQSEDSGTETVAYGDSQSVGRSSQLGDLRIGITPTYHLEVPQAPSLNTNRRRTKYSSSASMSNKSGSKKFSVNKNLRADPFRAGSYDLDYIDRLAFNEEVHEGRGRSVFGMVEGAGNDLPTGGVIHLSVFGHRGWEPISNRSLAQPLMPSLEYTSDGERGLLLLRLRERLLQRAEASQAPGVKDWLRERSETHLSKKNPLLGPASPPPPGWSQGLLVPTCINPTGTSLQFMDLLSKDVQASLLGGVVA